MDVTIGNATINVKPDMTAIDAMGPEIQQRMMGASRAIGIAMTAIGAPIVAGLGASVKMAGDFEQAITNAASVTGKTGEEFRIAKDKMRELALELGENTVFSARDAANAMYDLSSKGFDVAAMSVAELQPILDLATASQYDLTGTTEIVTSTLRGFGLANQDTTRIADVFTTAIGASAANMEKFAYSMPYVSTTANILGVSLEEVTAVLSRLYDRGIEASTAGSGLRNVLLEIQSPASAVKAVFDSLGVTQDDLNLKTHGLVGVFENLTEKGFTSEMALSAFEKRSGTVAASIVQALPDIKALGGELQNVGGAAAEVAGMQLDTFGGALEELKGKLETLMIRIGDALIPALRDAAEVITPLIGKISELASAHPELTQAVVVAAGAMATLFVTLGPFLIILPGLVTAVKLVGGAFAGLKMGAIALAGGEGLGALAAALGPGAVLAAAIIATTASIAHLISKIHEHNEAVKQDAETAQKEAGAQAQIIGVLEQKGIAYDKELVATMKTGDAITYLTGLYNQHVSTMGTAIDQQQIWIATLDKAGITYDAERLATMNAADAVVYLAETFAVGSQEIDKATAQGREYIHRLDPGHRESPSVLDLAQNSLGALVEMYRAAAQTIGDIWYGLTSFIQDILGQVNAGLDYAGSALGFAAGGVIPGFASGGQVGRDWRMVMVGERGPEPAFLPVGTRVVSHDEAVGALRGGGGGEGGASVTITGPLIGNAVVREDADVRRIAIELGEILGQRLSARGMSPALRMA